MAISFASAVGNLYNRLGTMGGMVKELGIYQQAQLFLMTDTTTGLEAQFITEPDIQAQMGSNYISLLAATGGNVSSLVTGMAASTVQRVVFRDNPLFNQNLTTGSTSSSLREIIRQMKIANATVLAMTITATPAAFIGVGNGVISCSVKRPSDGVVLENSFAENLTFVCSADSYTGGATAGNEPFQVTGEGNQSDFFTFDWPLGSNCFTQLSAINGAADNTQGNLLTNSGFETFTSNTPDNWTITGGTAGVNFFKQSTIVYDPTTSGHSLQWTGSGSTVLTIKQLFNDATGTTGNLQPLSQYSVCMFLCRDGIASTGILTVSLVDSMGTVLQDAAGVDSSFTVDLSTLTTGFLSFTGVLRTPLIMPSSVYLQFSTTTPYGNGRSFYMDKDSLGQMTQTYTAGPYVALHSGNTPFVAGDYATAVIQNSRGVAGTLNTWQTLFARLFTSQMYNEGLLLPSSASPSISDSLIG